MKRNVLLFVLLCAINMCVKSQIKSSEACFYLTAGKNPNSTASVWTVVHFEGDKAFLDDDWTTLWKIQRHLKENEYYYETLEIQDAKNGWVYEYDSSSSTNSMIVYKRYKPAAYSFGNTSPARYEFLAFSIDNSKLIRWWERNDEVYNKSLPLIRVEKSEVMPKGVNRDFLE